MFSFRAALLGAFLFLVVAVGVAYREGDAVLPTGAAAWHYEVQPATATSLAQEGGWIDVPAAGTIPAGYAGVVCVPNRGIRLRMGVFPGKPLSASPTDSLRFVAAEARVISRRPFARWWRQPVVLGGTWVWQPNANGTSYHVVRTGAPVVAFAGAFVSDAELELRVEGEVRRYSLAGADSLTGRAIEVCQTMQ